MKVDLEQLEESSLKAVINDFVNENNYLRKENRELEERIRLRPVNIFIDKKGYLLFIETEYHKKMGLERYKNIYGYFQKRCLLHTFYCDGIPVIQINLPKCKIYKLMKDGVI